MIKTTGFNNTLAGLNRKVAVENTEENFMNRMGKDYGHSIQVDKNLGVGQITICSNVYSAIMLLDDEQFKPLAFRTLKEVLGNNEGFNTGAGEYYGLFVQEIKADNVDMDYVTVSSDQEDIIIKEMISCDLTDVKNLRKIFSDINDLFRMYQELTIDAAKKLYEIEAKFYNEIMKANSTVGLDHNFRSFKDFKGFSIDRTSRFVAPKEAAIGEAVEFRNKNNEVIKVAFKDKMSVVQDTVADQFVEFVSNDVLNSYNNVKLSDKVKASFAMGSEFNAFAADMYEAIRKPYSKLTAWKSEEINKANQALSINAISPYACSKRIDEVNAMYDEKIDELSNLARYYTKDLDMDVAGRLMFMISNIKREKQSWVVDDESTNQLFLTVAPELFAAYIVAEHAEMKVCGYKVLGDTANLVEGQVLTFVNGNAQEVDNVYVDSNYTGALTVQIVDDVLSVVKPIEIKRIEAVEPKTIAISVYENSVIDSLHFAVTKEYVRTASFNTLTTQGVFDKAEKIQLVPFYSYKNNEGKTKHVYNAIVCTIPSLNDPSVKFEIPVCQYLCNSSKFESVIAGLTVSKIRNTSIDGKSMRLLLDFGTKEEVALNHSRVECDVFEDVNNDPFKSSVKVSNKEFTNLDDPFAQSEVVTTSHKIEDEAFGSGCMDHVAFEGLDEAFSDEYSSSDFSSFDFSQFA